MRALFPVTCCRNVQQSSTDKFTTTQLKTLPTLELFHCLELTTTQLKKYYRVVEDQRMTTYLYVSALQTTDKQAGWVRRKC